MRKGYKRRKGLIALASAFVLVALLSVPALAVDSSATYQQTVTINGTYVFNDGSPVLEYFALGESYYIMSGTIKGYRNDTLQSSSYVQFRVTSASPQLILLSQTQGTSSLWIATSDDTTSENPDFDAVTGDVYLVLEDVVVPYQSEIYYFLLNTKAATSSLVFTTSASGSPIVEVIVDSFNGVVTGLGSGVADFFQTLFIAHDGTGNLSIFAIVSLVFIGVAVAFGIARWIIKKVGQ